MYQRLAERVKKGTEEEETESRGGTGKEKAATEKDVERRKRQ